jgi:enoyl-CoA hydratase/carnithine racemase
MRIEVPTHLNQEFIQQTRTKVVNRHDERMITFVAEGDDFCLGADVQEMKGLSDGEKRSYLASYFDFLLFLKEVPLPILALVKGKTLGGGMGLLAISDYVVADYHAEFALPELYLKVVPHAIYPFLLMRMSARQIRSALYSASTFDTSLALNYGVMDEVSDDIEGVGKKLEMKFSRHESEVIENLFELEHQFQTIDFEHYRNEMRKKGVF